VEASPVNLEVLRLDQLIFDCDSVDFQKLHARLKSEERNFYPDYFSEILQLGNVDAPMAHQALYGFRTYELCAEAQHQIDSVFDDTDRLKRDFESAFGRLKTLFPNRNVPQVVMMNSGYNFGVVPTESTLAVGLEFYIGAENSLVKRLPGEKFPLYVREKMIPEQVLSNAMKGWLLVQHQDVLEKSELIDHITFYGKVMYMLHLILPEEPEHRHFAYTEAELNWCKENEFKIWTTIVSEDMTFSKDKKLIRNWTGNGPFTQGFAKESPGQLAYFMGKEMVKDYMAEHQDITMDELLEVTATEILNRYKPKN
jgi:hypothetical protein